MPKISAILFNIRSLHNVGSAFRTSDGAGVEKIYLCGYTPAPLDRLGRTPGDLAKTALGAEKTVPWERIQGLGRVLGRLKKEGYRVWAVEQDENSVPYNRAHPKPKDKIALLLGPEVGGISKNILRQCDKVLEIPMRGATVRQSSHPRHSSQGKESLNVSVAYGIVVYELTARR